MRSASVVKGWGVGEVDGPVEVVVGLDERGRHCHWIVEIGGLTGTASIPACQRLKTAYAPGF